MSLCISARPSPNSTPIFFYLSSSYCYYLSHYNYWLHFVNWLILYSWAELEKKCLTGPRIWSGRVGTEVKLFKSKKCHDRDDDDWLIEDDVITIMMMVMMIFMMMMMTMIKLQARVVLDHAQRLLPSNQFTAHAHLILSALTKNGRQASRFW